MHPKPSGRGWRKSLLHSAYWWLLLPLRSTGRLDRHRLFLFPCPEFLAFFLLLFALQYGRDGWAAAAQGSRGLVGIIWRAGDRGQTQRWPCHSRYVVQAARFLVARDCRLIGRSKFRGVFQGWISQLVVKEIVFGQNSWMDVISVSSDGVSKKWVRKRQPKMFIKQIWNERNSNKRWKKGKTSRRDRHTYTHTHRTRQDKTRKGELWIMSYISIP